MATIPLKIEKPVSASGAPPNYVEKCLSSLKANGARLTKTRIAVLHCLANTQKPLTPTDIMSMINEDSNFGTNIDLVSVYRILAYMNDLSLVHQVGQDGGYFPCEHTHCGKEVHLLLNCRICKNAMELHLSQELGNTLTEMINRQMKFEADPHAFEIKGICSSCNKN